MPQRREHPRPTMPEALRTGRVVAIARGVNPARLSEAAGGLLAGGVTALEVTLDSPEPLAALGQLADRFGDRLALGAGTVCSVGDAADALAAGATYLVSPHTDPELIAWAAEREVAMLPGAFTATEVLTAWRAGAAGVKVFPATPAGPAYVKALGGPLGGIPLIPTGGVDASNAGAFLAAGAVAVGVGGWLLGDADPQGVAARAGALRDAVLDATRSSNT